MDIFSGKKRHSEILVREKFFRPPKLGARSPPLHSPEKFRGGFRGFVMLGVSLGILWILQQEGIHLGFEPGNRRYNYSN